MCMAAPKRAEKPHLCALPKELSLLCVYLKFCLCCFWVAEFCQHSEPLAGSLGCSWLPAVPDLWFPDSLVYSNVSLLVTCPRADSSLPSSRGRMFAFSFVNFLSKQLPAPSATVYSKQKVKQTWPISQGPLNLHFLLLWGTPHVTCSVPGA